MLYDALHHAFRDPERERRIQRRPHLAREFSHAVPGGLVPLRKLLQKPGELARQPFRLEGVHPRARESPTLELADELVALVSLYAPRRVHVYDRRRRQRRPGLPAALNVPQPPGARVDQAPYPQTSLPVLAYPDDEGTLRVGGHREPPEFPRLEGERTGKRASLWRLSGGLPSGSNSAGSARTARKTTGRSSSRSMLAW